jgi:hypothetical protein
MSPANRTYFMTDSFSQDGSVRVRKRDGSTESLCFAKLLGTVRKGLEASGESCGSEPQVAAGLAEAVYDYARETFRGAMVDATRLAELVEIVLSQTGHAGACLAAQEFRALREQQRRRVMVAGPRPSDGRYVRRRWNKSHVVQHLRRHHGLDAPVSRMIAGRVELLVFNCGLKAVTTGLVLEMIKSELLAWGLLSGALVVKKTRGPLRQQRTTDT